MNSDLQAVQDLEALGRVFGWLLDELDVPPYIKDVFVELAKTMEPEHLAEMVDLIHRAVLEQKAAESTPEYQAQAAEIDASTTVELNTMLADLKQTTT